MGSDNLHHKRKQQNLNDFKRKESRRDSYDVVLIVCEGTKTEPNYLKGLRDELQLNSANIEILGKGFTPLKMIDEAIKIFNEKNKIYDRIYCVFDKDQHADYQNAINKIESHRGRKINSIPIYAINSVPCFEYWLLLHYVESDRPYEKVGSKSAGDQIVSELKKHIPGYSKGHENIFEITKPNLKNAIGSAKRISGQQKKNGSDNPFTNFYELVEYLKGIKNC